MLDPYLHSAAVTSKIGSQSTWVEGNNDIFNQFSATGDEVRSARSNLEAVINAGVRTILYDGDADFICNYIGFEAMVRASRSFALLSYSPYADLVALFPQIASLTTKFSADFAKQKFATYTVNGKSAGLYKNAGTLSYLRVFGAGHEVPAYLWRGVPRGAAALQMFTQIMSGNPLSGT